MIRLENISKQNGRRLIGVVLGGRSIRGRDEAMGQMQGRAQAAHSSATEIAHKSLTYAEKNFEATFDFTQKLMQAKDASEIMALQSEYLSKQMQALSSQVQDLGQSAAKIVVDAAKTKS